MENGIKIDWYGVSDWQRTLDHAWGFITYVLQNCEEFFTTERANDGFTKRFAEETANDLKMINNKLEKEKENF